jgi:hypothetical protein
VAKTSRKGVKAMSRNLFLGAAVLALGAALVPSASADTYNLTIDNCTGGCNPGSPGTSMGTVTVAQDGTNQLEFTVSLVTPLKFVGSGLVSTIDFNLTASAITLVSTSNSDFSLKSGTTGSDHQDGDGFFDYSLKLPSNGAGDAQTSPETFVVSCTGCTTSSVTKNTTGNYFGVDVFSNNLNGGTGNGNTGGIAANTEQPTAVPEASAADVMAADFGLMGLVGGFFYLRRKRGASTRA